MKLVLTSAGELASLPRVQLASITCRVEAQLVRKHWLGLNLTLDSDTASQTGL